ncbi:MAG: N-6 DNA methylase, partial [Planctomycetota bacterium]
MLDPACGSCNFLAAAARRLEPHLGPPAAASRVFGIDIDPTAVVLARASVSREHELTGNIRAGDALTDHPFDHPFEEPFDVVVGNPPFLNQLQSDTAVDRELARSLRDRTDGDVRGYSDMAAAFLRLALDWCRPGGRVGLVLPDSILATADARPVRASVARRATLRELWIADSPEFGAATVTTCAPILEIGGSRVASVARSTGAGFEPLAPLDLDHDELADAETWSQLTASMRGIPPIELADGATIADLADATADFRDQYYGLEGFILDLAEADDDLFPPIVTSGLIEPAACLWGRKPTRILKRRWDCPRIDLARMRRDGELAQWIDRRRIPKVIVATQTRVIEPFVDSAGSLVPSTPLITVTPKPDRSLWTIAAALASPVATALALGRYGGAALSADAIKLSAKQALRPRTARRPRPGVPKPARPGAAA